jgi:type I restriction enzyme S subunit
MSAINGMEDLPDGLASASILEFGSLIRGVSYSKGEAQYQPADGLVALLRANNISDELTYQDLQHVPENRVNQEQLLQVGDVIIAMSSGSKSVVGKGAQFKNSCRATFGAFCGVLRPCSFISLTYFGLFFKTKAYRNAISEASAGTNINNLKREYFEAIEIPLPPLAEQKRIVAKVETLLARVNAARQRLAKVPALLKRFRQSVLASACSGQLTEDWRIEREMELAGDNESDLPDLPPSWQWMTCDSLLDGERTVTYGVIKLGPPTDGGVPTLRSSDVRHLFIDGKSIKCISGEIASGYTRTVLRGGEILVTVRGTLGGVAVVPKTMAGYNISREVAMIPLRQTLDPRYVCFAIGSHWCQDWLTE